MLKLFIYRLRLQFKRNLFRYARKREGTFISNKAKGFWHVDFEGRNHVPERCHFFGKIKIGYATTLGNNNFFGGEISIGRYCQVGADVAIHSMNHPIQYLSTYINKNLFNGELKALHESRKVTIGNDVWIGHGVIILANVTIGNGAILAAGAVVTKDVPPYTIVAGVPAKPVKKRFSDSVIEEVENLKWWDLPASELEKIKPLFLKKLDGRESIYD